MPSKPQRILAYKLGEGYGTTSEGKPLYSWPYTVHYTLGYELGGFYLAEGDARNGKVLSSMLPRYSNPSGADTWN